MMKRAKKVLIAALSSIMVLGSATAFTSCEAVEGILADIPFVGEFLSGLLGTEVTLENIKVTANPTKMDYVAGEKFDPAGMEITAVYSDGSEKVVTDWTYSPTGELTKGQKVEVSYTEGEATKKVTVSINVTNDVVKLEIKTSPEKTEYYLGETFDPAGMVLTATYENEDTKDIVVSESTATYKTDPLTADDTVITITYAGLEVQQEITLLKGVFIEAEDGLLNGQAPNPKSTKDKGNFGMDATLNEAQAGALSLYEAKLKAAKMEELGVEATDPAITEYVASAEYEAAVDAYLASVEYKEDVKHYHASGDVYLGEIKQGDVVSFFFNSDEAGTGDIAFRLASAYLLTDNGNWTPSEIGNVQFNQLCEFYVNGVQYNIPDSATLEGGKTADGSFNQILWVNWKEVEFSDIDFIEGRNEIQLKFLDHNIESPAQDYDFTANVDCLIVTSDECEVTPCEVLKLTTVTLGTDIKLEEREGKAYFVVAGGTYTYEGEYSTEEELTSYLTATLKSYFYFDMQDNPNEGGFDGYTSRLENTHEIILGENNTFEIAVDVSSLGANALTVHLAPESLRTSTNGWNDFKPDVEASEEPIATLTVGHKTYELIYDKTTFYACVGIRISEVTLESIEVTTNPTKMAYVKGDEFEPAGMVITAAYSDESKEVVTNYTYSPEGKLNVGDKVVVSYTEGGVTKTVDVVITVTNNMTELAIKTAPNKTEYYVGETFEPAGMVLTATYENGETEDLTVTEIDAQYKTTALTADDTVITITYNNLTVNQNITVTTATKVVLLRLEVTTNPTKMDYVAGEEFKPDGMVITAVYSDETTEVVTNYTYSPEGELDVDDEVVVSYTKDEVTKTVNVPINVTNNVVKIQIKTAPTKTEYLVGEKFDPAGMVLEAVYENGDKEELDLEDVDYNTDPLTENDTVITFTYNGFTVDQKITLLKGVVIEAEDGMISSSGAKISNNSSNASGGKYVGDLKANDSITFYFNSDKAGTGDITFRLASQYLIEAGGEYDWTPILMGDCQLNKICEIYVNDNKYDIPDDVKLSGGGESGGEPNDALWYVWRDVKLTNFSFVEGKNELKLQFIRHEYDTCQDSFDYVFAANTDRLIVTSAECEIVPFSFTETAKLVVEDDQAYLVIENTWQGYTKDEAIAKCTTNFYDFEELFVFNGKYCEGATHVVVDENSRKLYINLSGLAVKNTVYMAHLSIGDMRTAISEDPADLTSVTVGGKTYTLSYAVETASDRSWATGLTIITVTDAVAE